MTSCFAVSDLTYMTVICQRLYISSGWKLPLEQSATLRHLSSSAGCFSEPSDNLPLYPIISLCYRFPVLYSVRTSGLAVLYLSNSK